MVILHLSSLLASSCPRLGIEGQIPAVAGVAVRVGSDDPTRQPQLQPPKPSATALGKRREGGSGEKVAVTEENLPKMKNVVILQNEGIIYCPIAKVNVDRGLLLHINV